MRIGAQALGGDERTIPAADLEVAVLARGSARRCFQRYDDDAVAQMLA